MKKAVAGVALLLFAARAEAFPYQESGQAVAFAMPAIAVGVALHKRDYKGIAQLAVVTGLTYGTAYALKQVIKSCRPYAKPCSHGGSGWDSMPSTTSAIASAPSSFMWGRYGWEWGLPMFVISKYPSWSMQKAKKNKLMDGLASTVLSFGFNQVFTTRYHRPGEQVFPERGWFGDVDGEEDGGVGATVGYRF
jgi:membrane-associated phospholipid phosphatase